MINSKMNCAWKVLVFVVALIPILIFYIVNRGCNHSFTYAETRAELFRASNPSYGGKRYGRKCWDGVKYFCLDDLPESGCLIYSFGISRDTSFETQMVSLNCTVYGYDHTIGIPPTGRELTLGLTVYGLAVDNVTEENKTTFYDAMASHGHLDKPITYLKVDIEGHEVKNFQNWMDTNALLNVQQIGLEMHTRKGPENFIAMVNILDRMGFKLISYDVNSCAGLFDGISTLFEVVFRRVNDQENICKYYLDAS
ncbi:uncharacterized protein LOC131880505 isoform X2 [Tigriopus californicus]|uniref:uncharacterized protein LOC131880505 isoform X2 n=1 Tax=Tigriopus californicus TaxID=6832 RepID=UPI0027DA03B0|nr:uncharacterized protein LOC131880505 isoform X2 [Tigriopus californicus]